MTKGKVFLVGLFCFFWAVFSPRPSSANPEYAQATGKQCIHCHGGSEVAGQRLLFGQSLAQGGPYHRLPPAARTIRFMTGHIGLIAAIGWFGAILSYLLIVSIFSLVLDALIHDS